MTFDAKIKEAFLYAFTGRETEMPRPEKSETEVLKSKPVPTIRWRHYELTSEQARYWAVELLEAATAAEQSWSFEEQARESKEER